MARYSGAPGHFLRQNAKTGFLSCLLLLCLHLVLGSDPIGRVIYKYGPSQGDTAGQYQPGGVLVARQSAASWTDRNDNLYVFGGLTDSDTLLCDMWMLAPNGQWSPLTAAGTNSVNQTGNYVSGGSPGCRKDATAWVDPSSGLLMLYGGYGYASTSTPGYLDDLWAFDPVGVSWNFLAGSSNIDNPPSYSAMGPSPSNSPGGRSSSAHAVASDGTLWLHGGLNLTGTLNDLWFYLPSVAQWSLVSIGYSNHSVQALAGAPSISNDPGSRHGHTGFFINGGNNFFVFGGVGADTTDVEGYLNDMYQWVNSSGAWQFVSGSALADDSGNANLPSARAQAASFAGNSGSLWLLGGFGVDGTDMHQSFLADIWVLNVTTSQWSLIGGSSSGSNATCMAGGAGCGVAPNYGSIGVSSASNMIGPRTGASAFHRVQSNMGYLFGGLGFDSTDNLHLLQDTWSIANTPPTPTIVPPTTLPTYYAHVLANKNITISGTFFGYTSFLAGVTFNLGLSSCTPLSSGYSFTTLTCTLNSPPTSSGYLTASFTSEFGAVSSTQRLAIIVPFLNTPSSLASFSANSVTSFLVTGKGFGVSSSAFTSCTITYSDGSTASCSISSVTPTQFTCSPSSSIASVSGPFSLQVGYSDGLVSVSSNQVVVGTITPVLAAPSNPANVYANTLPTSISLSGNGFGSNTAMLYVSLVVSAADIRPCSVSIASPTSLTCALNNAGYVPIAGPATATVTFIYSGVNYTTSSQLIANINPYVTVTAQASLPSFPANTIPSTATIGGLAFSDVSPSEMSVSLTLPTKFGSCSVSASSRTSMSCTPNVVTSKQAGLIYANVTRTYLSIGYSSTPPTPIMVLYSGLDLTTVVVSASTATLTVTGYGLFSTSSLTLSSASVSSGIPTCTITGTSGTTINCTLSGPFPDSGYYDVTIVDGFGQTTIGAQLIQVHPVVTVPPNYVVSATIGTQIIVSGYGFGAASSPVTVTLGSGAACANAIAISPTSLNCTLTSAATNAGPFTMLVTRNSQAVQGGSVSYGNFIPTLVPSSTITLASTNIILTIQGAALLGISSAQVNVVGQACGISNICSCSIIAASITGTSFNCTLLNARASGVLNATLVVGSYPSSNAIVGYIQPVLTVSTTNLADSAPSVTLLGYGLGTHSNVSSVVLSSGACSTSSANIITLTCTFTSTPTANQPLLAIVTVNGMPSSQVQVAYVVNGPVVTAVLPLPHLSTGASSMVIPGQYFGTDPAQITLTFAPSGQCTPAVVSSTSITCLITAGTLPTIGSTLQVTVTKNGGSNPTPVNIYVIVALPTVTQVTSALPYGTTSVVVKGNNFGSVTSEASVTFTLNSNSFSCGTLTLTSTTQISCALGSGISDTGILYAVVSVAGGSSSAVQISSIAIPPSIVPSEGELALTANLITVSGQYFTQVGAALPIPVSLTFSTSNGTAPVCTTVSVVSDTQIRCATNGGPYSTGTLSVSSLVINSLPTSASLPLAIWDLRDLPFISLMTSPAIPLGSTAALVITGNRFAGSVISVVVQINGVNITGYCSSPTFSTVGSVEQLTCPGTTWSTAGPITAMVTSDGLSSPGWQTVGVVRAFPTLTSSPTKYGTKTTSLTIQGAHFSLYGLAENVVTLTGGTGSTAVPCSVVSVSSTDITVSISSTIPEGTLFASISVAGVSMQGSPVPIGVIVYEPAATISARSIALNATSFVVHGTNLTFTTSGVVTLQDSLSNNFLCNTTQSISATSLRCNFTASTVLPSGPLFATLLVIDGVSSGPIRTQVAIALPIPVIFQSLQPQTSFDTLQIMGANFSTIYTTVITLSSGTCTVTYSSTSAITCSIDSSVLPVGPLVASITIAGGVSAAPTTVSLIYPAITPSIDSSSRFPVSQSIISISGNHFSPTVANNSVVLTSDLNGFSQNCSVISATAFNIRCTVSERLYAGTASAVVSVLSYDGKVYDSAIEGVASFFPIVDAEPIFLNATSGNITITGAGFEGSSVAIYMYNSDPQATSTPTMCEPSDQSYDSISCWPSDTPSGGVYTVVVSVDTDSGFEPSTPVSSIILSPVIDEAFAGKRDLRSLPVISTDTQSITIYGEGFDIRATHNLVTLSSGLCTIEYVNTSYITCKLSKVTEGTLSARVSTNSVLTSYGFVPIATVLLGSPELEPSPASILPVWNSSQFNGTSIASSKFGWTGGAIAGIVLAVLFTLFVLAGAIISFAFFRKDAGESTTRLIHNARKTDTSPTATTRSSAGNSVGPRSERPGERPMSKAEEDFILKLTMAGMGDRDEDEDVNNFLDSSSSDYLYRDDSDDDDEEEDGEEQDDEGDSTSETDNKKEAVKMKPVATPSKTPNKTPNKSSKASVESSSIAATSESKSSSEYLYTSDSEDAESDGS